MAAARSLLAPAAPGGLLRGRAGGTFSGPAISSWAVVPGGGVGAQHAVACHCACAAGACAHAWTFRRRAAPPAALPAEGAAARLSASHRLRMPRGLAGGHLAFSASRSCRSRKAVVSVASSSDGGGVEGGSDMPGSEPKSTARSINMDSTALPENTCIIESRENVKDFANMQLEEIMLNVESRRNKIFLLMEEVRRLRIQERIKLEGSSLLAQVDEDQKQEYQSVLPYLPPLREDTLDLYWRYFYAAVVGIIVFGGLVAPVLEVRLGVGGTSYQEFIDFIGLPSQLAAVDPIVASFCGGTVGVLSSLFVVEVNNVKYQAKQKCVYCTGSGYLGCGECAGNGNLIQMGDCSTQPGKPVAVGCTGNCPNCSGTGKVMCTSCLCTGKALATEHDPRSDPFN